MLFRSMRLVLFSVQLEGAVAQFLAMARRGSMVRYPRATPVSLFRLISLSLIDTSRTATLLSFVMSEYFEANKRNAQACSFGGNGTVNAKASSSSNATVVASSCLSSATGTFVPTAPSSTGSTSGSGSKSGSTHGAATTVVVSDVRGLLGVFLMLAISVAGGLLSLA